jgi:hypothetical protein
VFGSLIFYAGTVTTLVGLVSLVWPLGRAGIHTRAAGGRVAAAGVLLVIVALLLPDPTHTVAGRETLIDRAMPSWQFGERHTLRVRGTPAQVFRAIRAVRASDILLFRTLTWIRNPRRRIGGESILNAPDTKPILDVALASGFLLLAEEPDRELLIGTVIAAPADAVRAAREGRTPRLDAARFLALDQPGFVRAVMNFRATPDEDGWTVVTTETRVFAPDAPTVRRFRPYWRVIYPGSAIIRRMWLRAIRSKVEEGVAGGLGSLGRVAGAARVDWYTRLTSSRLAAARPPSARSARRQAACPPAARARSGPQPPTRVTRAGVNRVRRHPGRVGPDFAEDAGRSQWLANRSPTQRNTRADAEIVSTGRRTRFSARGGGASPERARAAGGQTSPLLEIAVSGSASTTP